MALQSESYEFGRGIGRKLTAKEALYRTEAHRKDEESRGNKPETYTEAEFFGLDVIEDLIKRNPGCVGIRMYYGINANDPDGPNTRRLTLVAVDAKGKDVFNGGSLRGLKDDGDGDAVGDGYTCPRHCPV